MAKRKIKTLRCEQVGCKKCPLRIYLCQRFIKDRQASIGHIIEEMYVKNHLSETEYKYVKKESEEYYEENKFRTKRV